MVRAFGTCGRAAASTATLKHAAPGFLEGRSAGRQPILALGVGFWREVVRVEVRLGWLFAARRVCRAKRI